MVERYLSWPWRILSSWFACSAGEGVSEGCEDGKETDEDCVPALWVSTVSDVLRLAADVTHFH